MPLSGNAKINLIQIHDKSMKTEWKQNLNKNLAVYAKNQSNM